MLAYISDLKVQVWIKGTVEGTPYEFDFAEIKNLFYKLTEIIYLNI